MSNQNCPVLTLSLKFLKTHRKIHTYIERKVNWYTLEKVVIDKTRKEQTNEVSPITQVATGSVHFCPFRISTWVLETNEKGGNGKQGNRSS